MSRAPPLIQPPQEPTADRWLNQRRCRSNRHLRSCLWFFARTWTSFLNLVRQFTARFFAETTPDCGWKYLVHPLRPCFCSLILVMRKMVWLQIDCLACFRCFWPGNYSWLSSHKSSISVLARLRSVCCRFERVRNWSAFLRPLIFNWPVETTPLLSAACVERWGYHGCWNDGTRLPSSRKRG